MMDAFYIVEIITEVEYLVFTIFQIVIMTYLLTEQIKKEQLGVTIYGLLTKRVVSKSTL